MDAIDYSDPASPFNFPLNECYVAFGDESINEHGAFYGLVLIPETNVAKTERSIGQIKMRYGGQPEPPIHCSQFFSPAGRSRTEWKELSNTDAINLCADILKAVAESSAKYLISHIPAGGYPKRVRLVGKNGHADSVQDVNERWITLQAFLAVALYLDPADIRVPADPVTTPSFLKRNMPNWRVHARRVDRGLRVRKIFLDREQAKIRWFSKMPKWSVLAKDLVIEGPMGSSHLPIEVAGDSKHALLEVADLFVYAATKKVLGDLPLRYDFPARDLIVHKSSFPEEVIFGGEQEPALAKDPEIEIAVSGKCVRFSVSSNRDSNLLQLTLVTESGKTAVIDFNGDFITSFQNKVNMAIDTNPGLAAWGGTKNSTTDAKI